MKSFQFLFTLKAKNSLQRSLDECLMNSSKDERDFGVCLYSGAGGNDPDLTVIKQSPKICSFTTITITYHQNLGSQPHGHNDGGQVCRQLYTEHKLLSLTADGQLEVDSFKVGLDQPVEYVHPKIPKFE